MLKRLILLFFVSVLPAMGLELEEFSLMYNRFNSGARNPYFLLDTEPLANRLSLDFNIHLFGNSDIGHFYWWHNIHGESSWLQFRLVGWRTGLGWKPIDWLEIGYEHHSQHALDSTLPYMQFPIEDSVYIKLILYQNPTN